MSEPKLIPIDLLKIKSCSHPDINTDSQYLAKIKERWYAARFSRVWYGLSFNAVYDAGVPLSYKVDGISQTSFKELYEIQ